MSAGYIDGASASGALSSLVADGSPLSAVLSYLLLLVAGSGLLSIVSSCFSSSITGSGLLSAIFGRILSFVASGDPLSAVFSRFLSFVTGSGLLSAILGRFLSFVTSSSPLFAVFGSCLLSLMLFASFRALFLTSTLSRAHYSFLLSLPLFYFSLPSLPILLACKPAPLTEKKLFDPVFITQRPIT